MENISRMLIYKQKPEKNARKNRGVKTEKIGWGAKRHHYSMVIIGRSMFEVHFSKQPWSA